MSAVINRVKAADGDDAVVSAMEADGAVIVEDFLAPGVLAAFNEEVDALMALERQTQQGFVNEAIGAFFGDQVNHVSGLAGKSQQFVGHVLCHPLYLAACDHFLLPACSDYQLNIAHLMERAPGCEAQPLHRDAWVWKRLPQMSGEVQIASLLALSDFSTANGGTLLVPGSHRWDGDRYPAMHEAVATEMPAGSAVLYLGSTFHAGGANTTPNSVRRGLHVSYTLGWLRTEENQCLATPLDVVRGLPERAQQLLGFGAHDDIAAGGGYLGTVDLQAPMAVMDKLQST
ncbi:MAG: phytanoyl-CoA dioxygenase family protein [Pseudomonadota bacterium]